MKFRHFPEISQFPKILSLSRSVTREATPINLVYKLIIVHPFTCGERKIWENIKKPQNIMKMTVCKVLFYFLCLY